MRDDWLPAAIGELAGLREPDGAWGYRRGAPGHAEPTALAGLALLAVGTAGGAAETAAAADWLATAQRPDGSLGATVDEPSRSPGWMTPDALLLWRALGCHTGACHRAAAWLLGVRGGTTPREADPQRIAGHDTTLVGWPWVAGTHSWLEPTALAVLALGRAGLGDHPRVCEGLALIRDRAVAGGGWNYGNKAVFGRPLRAQPGPTGLALLALAGTGPRDPLIERAIGSLGRTLPGTRAANSLGWGVLGLRAWGEAPEQAGDWLSESYQSVTGRPDASPRLAPLILAAADGSLPLFGRGPTAPAVSETNSRQHALSTA
jgi:hypothetical protein